MQLQSTSPSFITPGKTLLQPPSSRYSNTVTNHWFIHWLFTVNSRPTPSPTHTDINTPIETLHPDLFPKNTRPTLLTLFTARHISSSPLFLSNQTSQHAAVHSDPRLHDSAQNENQDFFHSEQLDSYVFSGSNQSWPLIWTLDML